MSQVRCPYCGQKNDENDSEAHIASCSKNPDNK